MKTKPMSNVMTILSVLGVASSFAGVAKAETPAGSKSGIVPGYFSSGSTDIIVEEAMEDGAPVDYGLIMREHGHKSAALYRIDELDDGTQSWVRLRALPSGLIGTDEDQKATWNVQVFQKGSKKELVLNPVSGNGEKIEADEDSGLSMKELPADGATVQFGCSLCWFSSEKVFVNKTQLSGDFKIGDQNYHGTFAIDPVIPAVGVLRAEKVDSETSSGRSLDRGISGLVVLIQKGRIFGSSDRLELIRISNTDGEDRTESIEQ